MNPLIYLLVDFENLQPSAADIARVRGEEYRLWIFHGPHQNKFAAEMVVAWQPLGDRVRFIQSTRTGKNALDFHIAFYLGQAQREDASTGRAARYVVVSKDGGFDALFDHMRSLGCSVDKATTIPDALDVAASLGPFIAVEVAEGVAGVRGAQFGGRSATARASKDPAAPKGETLSAAAPHAPAQPKKAATKSVSAARSKMTVEDVEKAITVLRGSPNNRPGDRVAMEHHIMCLLGNKVTMKVVRDVIAELEERKVVTFNGNGVEYKIPKAKKASG